MQALNALNSDIVIALRDQFKLLQNDDRVRCLVLHGSEKAFAAGADIKEMLDMDYTEMEQHDRAESMLVRATFNLVVSAVRLSHIHARFACFLLLQQMGYLTCFKPIVGAVTGVCDHFVKMAVTA